METADNLKVGLWQRLLGTIPWAVGLTVVAGLIGLAMNGLSPQGIPLLPTPTPTPAAEISSGEKVVQISLELAKRLYDEKKYVFIDSRYPEDYQYAHIDGAVNLPEELFDEYYPKLETQFKASPVLVVYCDGGSCDSSLNTAMKLEQKGYKKMLVISDGIPGWKRADYPIVRESSSPSASPTAETGAGQ